jgi:hypothetical protein
MIPQIGSGSQLLGGRKVTRGEIIANGQLPAVSPHKPVVVEDVDKVFNRWPQALVLVGAIRTLPELSYGIPQQIGFKRVDAVGHSHQATSPSS